MALRTIDALGAGDPPLAACDVLNGNIGRLTRMAFRRFEVAALHHLRSFGFEALRLTHLQILPYISASGIRTSAIATAANMTKQAVGQLAKELEHAGYVQRSADPNDGRAKLLCFTPKGHQLLAIYPVVLERSEADLSKSVDPRDFRIFRSVIRHLAEDDML